MPTYLKRFDTTIGCDPEFLIEDVTGRILSSCKFFPGKDNKLEFNCGKAFMDGVQAELNPNPSNDINKVKLNIAKLLEFSQKRIGENRIVFRSSALVERRILKNADPEARRFGCAPDFCAWTGTVNMCYIDGDTHRVRYGGGHIHVKMDTDSNLFKNAERFLDHVKLQDYILGLLSVLLDQNEDAIRRRKHYGKAGCFRETEYGGVEYRVPSNFWLKDPALADLMLGSAKVVYRICMHDNDKFFRSSARDKDVVKAINTNNIDLAFKIWNDISPLIVEANCFEGDPLTKEGIKLVNFIAEKGLDNIYSGKLQSWTDKNVVTKGFIESTLSRIQI